VTNANRDQNYVTASLGADLTDSSKTSPLVVDPVTGRLLVNTGSSETTYRQIETADDNVTTINYHDTTKTDVDSIVQSSVTVGATATETFNNAGATTLVITRSVT
jgi:hypothetical protein